MFDAIPFMKPTTKERKLYVENRLKAEKLKKAYDEAKARMDCLDEAISYFSTAVKPGDIVIHKTFKDCTMEQINGKYIYVKLASTGEVKQLGLPLVIANGIIKYDVPENEDSNSICIGASR